MKNADAGEVTQLVTSDKCWYTDGVLCGECACSRRSSRVCMCWARDRAGIMWIAKPKKQIHVLISMDTIAQNHATDIRNTPSSVKDHNDRSYISKYLSTYPHSRRSATAPPATAAPSH